MWEGHTVHDPVMSGQWVAWNGWVFWQWRYFSGWIEWVPATVILTRWAQTASEDAQRQPMLRRLHVLLGEEPIPHMYYYIQEQWQWYEEYHDEYEWFWTTMPHNSNLNGKHHASKLM